MDECGDGEPIDPTLLVMDWGYDVEKKKEAMRRKAAPWLKWKK